MRAVRALTWRKAGAVLAAGALTVALSACNDDDGDGTPSGAGDDTADVDGGDAGDDTGGDTGDDTGGDTGDGGLAPGVPEECAAAFIGLLGPADLAEVEKLPSGWPDPPVEATLCVTTETTGGHEEAGYATTATPEEVVNAYEAVLGDAGADVTRDQGGLGGEILYGTLDGVEFQITPRDGAFDLLFPAS